MLQLLNQEQVRETDMKEIIIITKYVQKAKEKVTMEERLLFVGYGYELQTFQIAEQLYAQQRGL